MRFLLRAIIAIGVFLLILIVVLISLALVLGVALGVGWLLRLILPSFSLFEASLLGIIASAVVGFFWYNFINSIPEVRLGQDEDYDEEAYDYDEDIYEMIPASRFYKTNADKTWEAWFRYQIANGIYVEFQDSPQPVAPMGEKQLQELAIRLADVAISLLKGKTARTKRLKVSVATLKRQMTKIGQRPYDDDIVQLAVEAINEEVDYHYEDITTVIRAKLWSEPCEMFD